MRPVATWRVQSGRLLFFSSLVGFAVASVWHRFSWAAIGCCGFSLAQMWYMLKKAEEAQVKASRNGHTSD